MNAEYYESIKQRVAEIYSDRSGFSIKTFVVYRRSNSKGS